MHGGGQRLQTPNGESQPGVTPPTEGELTVSTETTSGISDEEAPERSRDYELTASPWIGLHYKYEHGRFVVNTGQSPHRGMAGHTEQAKEWK